MNTAPSFRTSVLALLAVPALAFSLAACSSGGGSEAEPSSASKVTGVKWDAANAKCLRDKGYDIPDPTGGGAQQAPGLSDDTDMEAFNEDFGGCIEDVTKRLGPRPTSDKEKKEQAAFEKAQPKINECLRKKGYEVDDDASQTITSSDGSAGFSADDYEACSKEALGSK
ncbi:hypothetical protein [Frondihabitans cladoniiphilus]|uniref:Host cell surface-exposed lipoprotein n=1 Tax=Frondihabitans cladoniiphilus TaxID=715785 RepID=A0ABP8VT79_9MICO